MIFSARNTKKEKHTCEIEVSVRRTHSSRSSRSRRWQERTSACFDDHHNDDYNDYDVVDDDDAQDCGKSEPASFAYFDDDDHENGRPGDVGVLSRISQQSASISINQQQSAAISINQHQSASISSNQLQSALISINQHK